MIATMMRASRSCNDVMPLRCRSVAAPLGACLATTTPRLGDNANLGNDATPLGARSVMTTPSSETLGDNTKLGNDSALGNNTTLANNTTPLNSNTKLVTQTL